MDSSPGAVRPELVLLERPEQGVALLRLNRPAVLNALNMRLREALAEHVRRLDECADTRVIVLTGNGTAFAARAEVRHYPCDHFDVFAGGDWFDHVVEHQIAFLARHLAGATATVTG